ncbi:hypothetical protein CsSME_00013082 [Camellia sinensis var. sinensis]
MVDKELHQKEVHEITQQAFATKDCETNTNTEDCQNSQLQNQLVEEEVHDLTQQVCPIKADDLTESRQTNLKTTEISDYEYGGKKFKIEKEKEHKDETISNKYILEKEPQAQNSSDGAEHNGKSFVLSSLYWDWDKLSKSLILTQTEVFSHSRTLVPYPLIPDSGILADNLGLAEIISAS